MSKLGSIGFLELEMVEKSGRPSGL
jgi:hypothetical protein